VKAMEEHLSNNKVNRGLIMQLSPQLNKKSIDAEQWLAHKEPFAGTSFTTTNLINQYLTK
jgi:hypothetical protein